MQSHAIPLMQRSIDTQTFVERTALIDAALARQTRGLLVITAPSGYGKSALARRIGEHWSQQQACPLRVWTLRSTTTLTQALRSFCEIFGFNDRPTLLSPDVAADTALEAIAACADPGVLLVDLDGAPPAGAVKSLAAQILTEFAMQQRALVACRNPWLLSLERIALSAPVQIFESEDLAFDVADLMRLHRIDETRAQRWLAVSEGWPLLCGPRLPAAHDPLSGDVDALTSLLADRASDYLEHEVLAALPARDAQLLMQASIFEAVEPGTLETLGSEHSWSRFCGLLEASLPVSLAHSTRDRVVLHPVLRAFLGRRLRTHSPAVHHSLHRRAATSYAAVANHRLALAHARQTGDAMFIDQVTENSGGWRISWSEGLHALAVSTQQATTSGAFPKAALARAYWLAQTGRLDEAEILLRDLQGAPSATDLALDLETIDAVIDVYRDAPFNEERTRKLATHTQPSGGGDLGLGPGAATVAAAMLNNAACYERALPVARAAALDAAAVGSRYVAFYGQWQCALALHGLGQVNEALAEYEGAGSLADEIGGEAGNEARVVRLDAAHAAYLAGQDDLSERLAGDLSGLYRLHAWFESYARALEVAAALSRQRADRMLESHVLQSFGELAQRRALPRLDVLVELGHAQQARADGDTETAARHCAVACEKLRRLLPADAPGTLRVSVPVEIEVIRLALLDGRLHEATARHAQAKAVFAQCSDGAIALEAALFEAYLAVHAKQYKAAAQRLAQCVLRARRHGLMRPLRDNAGLVGEIVECARARALPIDSSVLQSAMQMSKGGVGADESRRRANLSHNGRMLLTEREMDTLHFLADGLSSKEMARRLRISEGTVKTHRKHLYEKLNVGLRSQAITRARELGLL